MEITKLEGGGRVPPTLQGGTPVSTSSPVSLTGTTHTQKIVSLFLKIIMGGQFILNLKTRMTTSIKAKL